MSNDADRTLVWPDGSIYRITRSSADTGGELLEMEWELPAHGWAPQPHVHPRLTEEYQVLEGSLEVLVGSEWRTLTAGDGASVPPGTVHTFRVGDSPVRVRNVHRPALDFEPYIKRLCSAANQRNLGDLSGFRALLYIAVLVREFPQHSRAPGRLLNLALPAVAALGRVLGFRASRERWRASPRSTVTVPPFSVRLQGETGPCPRTSSAATATNRCSCRRTSATGSQTTTSPGS